MRVYQRFIPRPDTESAAHRLAKPAEAAEAGGSLRLQAAEALLTAAEPLAEGATLSGSSADVQQSKAGINPQLQQVQQHQQPCPAADPGGLALGYDRTEVGTPDRFVEHGRGPAEAENRRRRLGELVAEFRAEGLEDAGARARYAMVNECIERTLPPPDPARCDHCGGPEGDDMKLPLFDWSCRRWVHGRCVRAWQAGRRAEAAEARERFGVIHPDRRE